MKKYAFGLIDAQRGFMPAAEGERLGVKGFGELPINQGEEIVNNANALLGELALKFTTQDYHPYGTAHFDVNPNFKTTWPPHCVGGTAGAELHPEINLPDDTEQFYKGAEILEKGEDDTSYSGYNALRFEDDLPLPEWLQRQEVTDVILGGLALDYCVKATALDLRQKAGLNVTVVTDATEPVAQETGLQAIDELEAIGVRFATTEEILQEVKAA